MVSKILFSIILSCVISTIATRAHAAECYELCNKMWWDSSTDNMISKISVEQIKTQRDENGATPLHFAAISKLHPDYESALYEIDIERYLETFLGSIWPLAREELKLERDTVGPIRFHSLDADSLKIRISNSENGHHALRILKNLNEEYNSNSEFENYIHISLENDLVNISLSPQFKSYLVNTSIEATIEILTSRQVIMSQNSGLLSLNLGAASSGANVEFQLTSEGNILLDWNNANLLNTHIDAFTAQGRLGLYRIIGATTNEDILLGPGQILLASRNGKQMWYIAYSTSYLKNQDFLNIGTTSEGFANFRFTPFGARLFNDLASENIGETIALTVDKQVVFTSKISQPIVFSMIYTGKLDPDIIGQLALYVNTGALPISLIKNGHAQYATTGSLHRLQSVIDELPYVDFMDKNGQTPLHWAYRFGDPRLVAVLINNGASSNIKDNYGMIPEDYADKNPTFTE